MTKEIIHIIDGNPKPTAFSHDLTKAYAEGAKEAGHTVTVTYLKDLTFDPILRTGYRDNILEPDLQKEQEYIKNCTHLVIVTPVWWLSTTALLKGYFDRILTPGFGYKYKEKSILPLPIRLLKGRSARVIYTQGGPFILISTLGFDSFWKAMKYGTLMFCGFGPVRRTVFSSIVKSTPEERNTYLSKVRKLGQNAR
jgi:putative NADPH-quinone reductase